MENYRLSSYSIHVPLEKFTGKQLLVHGYTGAIDEISSDITAYLQENKNALCSSDFPYSNATWEKLIARGYLTRKTKDEELRHVKKFADLMHKRDKALNMNFGFLVSYDCNFRCPYCSQAEVSMHGQSWGKEKFTKETVDEAYVAIAKLSEARRFSKSLLLYGGEPLLKFNREVVEYIVERGKALGFVFYAVTNGYDLGAYKDLLGKGQIEAIQVTLDGWRDKHDKTRTHKNGQKTFDKIVDNISMALDLGTYVGVRMNSTGDNIESIKHLAKFFQEKNLFEHDNFKFRTTPVVDYQKEAKSKESRKIKYLSRAEFCGKIGSEGMNHFDDWGIRDKLEKSILDNTPVSLNSCSCGAHIESYIFDPEQRIYACWDTVGRSEKAIGDYSGNEIRWTEEKEKWHNRNSGRIDKCSGCKYVFLCKGGCVIHALKNGGDFFSSECHNYHQMFKISANRAYESVFLK